MLPMLRQGVDSVVLFPLPEKLKKYDLPFYQRDNGQYVLHRVVKSGASYTCIGDNQFDYETGLRHVQMIALVTAFYRGIDSGGATVPSIAFTASSGTAAVRCGISGAEEPVGSEGI